ncbi:hypothetical protein [Algoriphagus zhangzhouensis]|uniref:Uncharacterized protein n=1 Tax=Algoriphagus zhangzhouensis TaxID=1073327 RepID=A0A1M7ZEE4_9BACT|nr:hypothetical protein [Algoriphagus zhangzhouensis]TDY46029.1 hypothetical protein A8938_2636 [Algoriphagus zhangzhouensis]SHO63260.1 hypothetical protein SAMN04488108_2633 [Algoriphagus zhangzhouensis]
MFYFFQKHYLNFRNFFYTQELKKYGVEYARSGDNFGLFTLVFFPCLYGLIISALIAVEFGFRYQFESENKEVIWTLILSGITIIFTYFIHRRLNFILVPKEEPKVQLEETQRKKYLRTYMAFGFGPLLFIFFLIFCFYF